MQSNDARILGGAAIPTGIAGLAAIVAGLVLAGGKGALGSAIGAAVVLVFFSLGVLIVNHVARVNEQMLLVVGVFSYLVKLALVFALIVSLRGITVWSPRAFAWTVIALTLVWLAGEANVTLGARTSYVRPAATVRDADKSDA